MKTLDLKQLGNRLRVAREACGLSQGDVASALGLSQSAYSHFERGTRVLGLEYLDALSEILQRPPTYCLGMSSTPGLTPEEDELLSYFRQLPDEARPVLLRMFKAAATGEEIP